MVEDESEVGGGRLRFMRTRKYWALGEGTVLGPLLPPPPPSASWVSVKMNPERPQITIDLVRVPRSMLRDSLMHGQTGS